MSGERCGERSVCDRGCLDHLDDPSDSSNNPFVRALREGHFDCFREAHKAGVPWDEVICVMACVYGRVESLRYAHENGCPWDAQTTSTASCRGHVDCLRYAHEHGCPWDDDTCVWASLHSHLDCLRYAHEHGCPWDSRTVYVTLTWRVDHSQKTSDCLAYALENGCPVSDEKIGLYRGINQSALSILYHFGIPLRHHRLGVEYHIRDHIRRARLLLRCAVRWLRAYGEACSRVYAPDGEGYRMAETSFLSSRERDLKN